MMQRSNSGTARVSAIWMILVFVLFLGATMMAYSTSGARTKAEELKATAEAATEVANQGRAEALDASRRLSEILGWYDRDNASARSDVALADSGLSEFKNAFGGMSAAEKTWEESWPQAASSYQQTLNSIRTLEGQVADLRNQVSAANSATSSVTTTKDKSIRELEQQLADAQSNAQGERNDLERQLSAARNQFTSADASWKASQAELADEKRGRVTDGQAARTRHGALTRAISEQSGLSKEKQGHDGEILATSASLNIAYLNLGASDRVSRGMRFEVTSGKPGSTTHKGTVEVIDVEANRAVCKIISLMDPYDPIVERDLVSNPLFVPGGERNAIMAGRFSGSWNEAELRTLMGEIGLNVQSKMDKSTAFLIVGDPLYNDPETGEPLEEPMAISELGVYKDAEAAGLTIVSIEDIRRFFVK